MKSFIKMGVTLSLMLMLTAGFILQPAYAVDIYYQNKLVQTDVKPIIENGRTLVPIAVIAEEMGAEVNWNPENKKITIKKDGLTLHLTLGSAQWGIESKEGGYTALLDVPAKSIQGRAMVPLSAIAEAFGSQVAWDTPSKTVLIDSDASKLTLSPKNPQKSDNKTEALVRAAVKTIPGFASSGVDVMKANITVMDNDYIMPYLAMVRERIPGKYQAYAVIFEQDIDPITCLVNLDNNQVYHMIEGIYSIPNFSMVVPPAFDNADSVEELIHALLIQNGKLTGDETLSVNVQPLGQVGGYIPKWKAVSTIDGSKKTLPIYEVDISERKVIDKTTGKIIYDDFSFANYPEKQITEKNAASEAMKILTKLKRLDPNGKYSITDIKPYGVTEDVEFREGYLLTVREQAPDPNVTNIAGTFFINSTGTVMMEYDIYGDIYYYIYGSLTPMG